jgi:hypothetical protein
MLKHLPSSEKLFPTLIAPTVLSGKLSLHHITARNLSHLQKVVNAIHKTSYIRFTNHMTKITVHIQCSPGDIYKKMGLSDHGEEEIEPCSTNRK